MAQQPSVKADVTAQAEDITSDVKEVADESAKIVGGGIVGSVQSQLNKLIYLTAGLIVFVFLLTFVTIGYGYYVRAQAIEASQSARLNICIEVEKVKSVQRAGIQKEIQAAQEFLRNNPHGIPGISSALIHEANDRRRVQLQQIDEHPCTVEGPRVSG